MYDMSYIGFHDRFSTNFSRTEMEEMDLNRTLASLLLRLLLLRFRYSYLMGQLASDRLKLDTSFPTKLLVYYRYKI